MLMQQNRPLVKSHIMARCRPMTAGRIATQRLAMQRSPSHALAPHQTFAARRIPEPEPQSSGTLLPWADPYIADLHRRHEGELRRERIAGRDRE
jgi:hypothetical protein